MGAYIGLFEWLVWSRMNNVEVHMLFGSSVVVLSRFLGVQLPPVPAETVHRACAVRGGGSGSGLHAWLSSCPNDILNPEVNHYLAGQAASGHTSVGPSEPGGVGLGGRHESGLAARRDRSGGELRHRRHGPPGRAAEDPRGMGSHSA